MSKKFNAYKDLPRCGAKIFRLAQQHWQCLADLESAETTEELGEALKEERAVRDKLLVFLGSFDFFTRYFDPYTHFASDEQERITYELISDRVRCAIDNPEAKGE